MTLTLTLTLTLTNDSKQAASARRAATIEIARGAVSARNETRDERIERLRLRGLEAEVARMRQSRALARASLLTLT